MTPRDFRESRTLASHGPREDISGASAAEAKLWCNGRVLRSLGLAAAAVVLSSCGGSGGVIDPKGPVASGERLLLINATEIMLVVIVPVIVLTLAFAWWFRASNSRATYLPEWEYSGRIELVVWSIPAMIVILLAGVGWIGSHQLDPRAPIEGNGPPIRIQAVSLDWKWLFIYPDKGVATLNELTVPAGTPLNFELTSATVMNAFFVPQLGSQIYTMPGMASHLNLLASSPGDFAGLSSHFSGDGFSKMNFTVHSVSPDAFEAWARKAGEGKGNLDENAYNALLKPGTANAMAWRDVSPNLFATILKQAAPGSQMAGGMLCLAN